MTPGVHTAMLLAVKWETKKKNSSFSSPLPSFSSPFPSPAPHWSQSSRELFIASQATSLKHQETAQPATKCALTQACCLPTGLGGCTHLKAELEKSGSQRRTVANFNFRTFLFSLGPRTITALWSSVSVFFHSPSCQKPAVFSWRGDWPLLVGAPRWASCGWRPPGLPCFPRVGSHTWTYF